MLQVETITRTTARIGAEMTERPRQADRPTRAQDAAGTPAHDKSDERVGVADRDVDASTEVRHCFTEQAWMLIESGPWSFCWIGIFHKHWEGIALHCGASRAEGTFPRTGSELPDSGAILLASQLAAEHGQPLILPDTRNELDFRQLETLTSAHGVGALVIIPVRFGERPGALWLGVDESRELSQTEVAYSRYAAATFINQWRLSESTARLEEAVQAQSEQLDEFAQIQNYDAQQREHLEAVGSIQDTLLPIVLNEQGLTALTETAAALLNKPVLLFDPFDRLVTQSRASTAALQSAEIGLGPHLRMYFNRDGAKADFVTIGGQRFLIVPLFSERRTLGNLCINFPGPPGNDREIALAEHVGLFFALELLKRRIRLDVQLRLSGDFFRSLLSDTGISPRVVADRASQFGFDLVRPSATLRARITPAPTDDWFGTLSATAWLLRAKLAEVGASAVVSPSSDSDMVIVVNADPAPLLRDQILPAVRATLDEVLARQPGRFVLDIGVGTIGVGIDGIRASHDTAVKALALIDALGLQGTDLDITDFATYGLLLDIETAEQERYIHRLLGPIYEYDAQHSTDLLKTLEYFLDALGSVQRCADKLYLHPTTVRYRLARVEELTRLQLDNSEHRLALSLALHLHRLSAWNSRPGPAT